jgi:preprotein translocase subunit SecG
MGLGTGISDFLHELAVITSVAVIVNVFLNSSHGGNLVDSSESDTENDKKNK